MSNMSYCKFRNTLPDLQDCVDALYESDGNLSDLCEEERSAARALIRLCREVAEGFDEDDV